MMTRDELRTELLRDMDRVLESRMIRNHLSDTQVKIMTACRQVYANDNAALDVILNVLNVMG